MTSFKFFAATVILSTVIATPVFAQAAISEPGAFAFYHPNGDLGLGSSRPVADALASMPLRHSVHMARARTGSHSMLARSSHVVKAD
jgi:hypothetical protein